MSVWHFELTIFGPYGVTLHFTIFYHDPQMKILILRPLSIGNTDTIFQLLTSISWPKTNSQKATPRLKCHLMNVLLVSEFQPLFTMVDIALQQLAFHWEANDT